MTAAKINVALGRVAIAAIRGYQWTVSPLLAALFGSSCRFTPSCSAYAVDAVHEHGAVRGLALALRRIARCQPFARAGYDPVPRRLVGTVPGVASPRLRYVPNPQE